MPDISKRCPVNGTFELTGRCNLSCKMCLIRVDKKRIEELGLRERTAEEWIDMARQAAEAGTLGLLLTGGEVMLRPDFCEIYEAIAKMGFLLTLYTNATMVTDEIMDVLERYPPHKIGVTMYGASNETYERLCGNERGFERFVDGSGKLLKLPSLFDIRTTIVQDNLADLQKMKDFTQKYFGKDKVLHISRNVVNSIRDGIECPRKVRLSPEENIELIYPWLEELESKFHSGEIDILTEKQKMTLHRTEKTDGGYIFQECGAGINQYTINWSGYMYACEMMPVGCTYPFEDGFKYAWDHLIEQYPLGRSIEKCNNCNYAALCDSCPANRMAETGDWFGIPEYACKQAKYLHQRLKDMHMI